MALFGALPFGSGEISVESSPVRLKPVCLKGGGFIGEENSGASYPSHGTSYLELQGSQP
jgi:hypothetical protein